MRVLLIANTLPHTDISGVGEQVVQLAAGLESAGHEVEILGRGSDGAVGPKLLFPFTVVPPALRRLYRFRPHVVQVHESDGALVALVVRTLQAMFDPVPRLVALLQVSYLEELRAVRPLRVAGQTVARPGLEELMFRWLKAPVQVIFGALTAALADVVMAPSRQTAREIERDYRVSSVRVLRNVTGTRGREASELQAPAAGDFLLFVGRLRIRKGVEILLHAIARLRRSHPETRLLVVGEGEHGPAISAAVSRLGLEDVVTLLGRRPVHEIPALMAAARALVVPSIYEGMPLVIVEAMAAGLPVVASAVSGIPEVVRDGDSGWLVAAEDVEQLTAALRQVYDDPPEAVRRGARGRELARQEASAAEAARRWLILIAGMAPFSSGDEGEVHPDAGSEADVL